MKLALFGGSFDPVHNGHLEVVLSAIKNLDIDKLIIMPAFLNPFKCSSNATPEQRLKWVKKTFEKIPKVEVCEYEIKQKRSVSTIESVEYLIKNLKTEGKIQLIIGADNLMLLPSWKEYDKLLSMCEIIVATRSGYNIEADYKILSVKYDISSTNIREKSQFDHLPSDVADEIIKQYKKD